MALVELRVAVLAYELRQKRVAAHWHAHQALEVGAEERRRSQPLLRRELHGLPLQLAERVPQAARGKLPVAQSAKASAKSTRTCGP